MLNVQFVGADAGHLALPDGDTQLEKAQKQQGKTDWQHDGQQPAFKRQVTGGVPQGEQALYKLERAIKHH